MKGRASFKYTCIALSHHLIFVLNAKIVHYLWSELKEILTKLLDSGASINFYMFRGGTNFGFMNGAKIYHKHGYKPVVTSYGRYNLIGGKKNTE